MEEAYTHLITFLNEHGAHYTLLDHPPEGRTEIVSAMRGHKVAQAAKCIVLMVKIGKKITKYVLAVVPGDTRVDLHVIKSLMNGTYVSFATPEIAERVAGSVIGTILPFAFNPEVELLVDPALLDYPEIYFNAARLDRSLALRTADYVALAKPRIEAIAAPR
jgi:Ala-tRNA(Pro) deacylase